MGTRTGATGAGALPLLFCLMLSPAAPLSAKPADFERMKMDFATEASREHGLDAGFVQRAMAAANFRQPIIDAISRPAEKKPWHQYRPIFVTPSRVEGGVEYWKTHADLLAKAEKVYGVPPEIIVAVIGVETRYGRQTGSYPVLDALATLAFGYPRRAAFFRNQLEHFLLLSLEENIEPEGAKGSYAGAMGKPQFIPSSYRSYAIDFDGDGQRDLWNSDADVIGSVGAYLYRHGWQRGAPIAARANGGGTEHDKLVEAGMKPSLSPEALRVSGIAVDEPLAPGDLASLVKLENQQGPEYWVGLNNFYVITRYNHSNLYAMAVYQLSQEIRRRMEEAQGRGGSA